MASGSKINNENNSSRWFNGGSTIVQRLFNDWSTAVQKIDFPAEMQESFVLFTGDPYGVKPVPVFLCYKQEMPMASGSGINNETIVMMVERWSNGG